ncbi:MAG: diaminopropionate ammonia-lyase [Luminiphilus sp.]|nr:diaminopropionate ammonia-lyase [Luminiphilus sp.]MDG2135491.1 diaminopropionate ammonia-lyase [Luminiphilus sp.]
MSFRFSYSQKLSNSLQDNLASHIVGELFSADECDEAHRIISQWQGYQPTPLISLSDIAASAGVDKIYYKDESGRFDLGSFKALGGAYAIDCLVREAPEHKLVVCTATDGNHGRSVAWAARFCDAECHIFLHSKVSEAREDALAALGATIHRVEGNYDDSIVACRKHAVKHGWQIVSDTSWPGYRDVPKLVMTGYSVMTHELIRQLGDTKPTHIILQAGCGAMAGALIASMWLHWGPDLPKVIVVESDRSDCVYQSLKRDQIHLVNIVQETLMAGLSCGEVSELAWPIIREAASHVITINDEGVGPMVRWLANPTTKDRPAIVAGECSASGLIALLAIRQDPSLAGEVGVDDRSRVLVIGTEGDTDAAVYAAIMRGDI